MMEQWGLEHVRVRVRKTECWYIIAADEGAEIIYGHNAKSKEELQVTTESKNWDQL